MESDVALILGNIVFLWCELLCLDVDLLKELGDPVHDVFSLVLLAEIHLESKSAVQFNIFRPL